MRTQVSLAGRSARLGQRVQPMVLGGAAHAEQAAVGQRQVDLQVAAAPVPQAEPPLGTQRYQLLGTSPFSPDQHKGHKMAVKGLLIKSGSDTRINVTSFQMLAETCAK